MAAGSSSGSPSACFQYRSTFGDTTLTKVFVGGLAWETPTDKMREYFMEFGEILEAVIITDKITGKSKGYGFVTFCDADSAKRAVANANPMINGRRANCNIAAAGRPRHSPPRGRGEGQSGQINYPGAQGGPAAQGLMVAPPPVPVMYPSYGYTAYNPHYGYPQAAAAAMYHQQAQFYQQMYGSGGASSSTSPTTIQPPHHPYYYAYSMQAAAASSAAGGGGGGAGAPGGLGYTTTLPQHGQGSQGPYFYYSPSSPLNRSPPAGSYSWFHPQVQQQQDLYASADSSRLQQLPSQIDSPDSSPVTSPETEAKVVPSESPSPSD